VSVRSSLVSNNPRLVLIPDVPSGEVLEAIGHAVVLFAQLEHYLKVIYKRAIGGSLPDILDQRSEDSLGGLLNGVTNRGKDKDFVGLQKLVDDNATLRSVKDQLKKASECARVRKKYLHGGIARQESGNTWVFLKSGEETSEAQIIPELTQVSNDIRNLIKEIQEKIPTPKS